MRVVKHELAGKTLYMRLSGEAYYDIEDKYGSVKALVDKLENKSKESFITICEVAALLAEQGELARRFYGYDKQEIIGSETIRNIIQPSDIPDLTTAIFKTITAGFGREVEAKDDVVDLGLIELEEQKKTK